MTSYVTDKQSRPTLSDKHSDELLSTIGNALIITQIEIPINSKQI